MQNLFEIKIIQGIAEGVIKPSEIKLSTVDFDDSDIATLFTCARSMEAANHPIDLDGLFDFATTQRPDDFFLSKKEFQFLNQISKSVVYQAVQRVKDASSRKNLVDQIRRIADGLEDRKTSQIVASLKAAIEESEKSMSETENGFVFISELAEKTKQVYEDFHAGISYAVPTYFKNVDNSLLDGFSKGDLHLIAGMSGQGKSALMLNFAKNQARNGFCVGVVSLEMSDVENVMRLQAADAKIPRWFMRSGLYNTDLEALLKNLEELSKLKIAFNTMTGDIYSLPYQVREMVDNHGLNILYVDYAQLYEASEHNQTKAAEVSKISRTLKQIAMENHIPVVALTQFAKSAINAGIFELSDHFKESSSLKQDASTAMVVQLEQTQELKQFKTAKVLVLKNRNGATFQPIDMEYQGELFTFAEV